MTRIIEIVPPDSTWPTQYQTLAEQIMALAGPHLSKIHHIGSTAVAGLAAKDVIDLQITVARLPAQALALALTNAGFRQTPNATDNLIGVDPSDPNLQKLFFAQPEGQRPAHVHVRELGRTNQEYPILFRDFLRVHTDIRDAYATIKRALASHFSRDIDAYYAIKDPYMDTVYRAAKLWQKDSNWRQDDGDAFIESQTS